MADNDKCRTWAGRVRSSAIRRFVRQVAERFQPEKIILFGSYASGRPNVHSDVDILVVMPAANVTTQAVRIRCATDHPFPLDLLVRTPKELAWRLQEGDWFCQEIVERGKVLYEQVDRRVDAESRKRSNRRHKTVKGSSTRT